MNIKNIKKYLYDFAAVLLGGAVSAGTVALSHTDAIAPVLVSLGIPPAYAAVLAGSITTVIAQRMKTPQQRIDEVPKP
jgi:hypothetical protein